MEIEIKLRKTLAEVFNTQPEMITLQTKQQDLEGWDSLGQLRLVMTLEDSFNVSFDINEVATMTTVEVILEKIRSKLI